VQERAALRLLKQLFCCQLILKLRILWRFRTAARLPRFEIPVETFTSPYLVVNYRNLQLSILKTCIQQDHQAFFHSEQVDMQYALYLA